MSEFLVLVVLCYGVGWVHLPYELSEKVSNRIINEISGIPRVATMYSASHRRPLSGNNRPLFGFNG